MVRHGLRLEGAEFCLYVQGMHRGDGFGERSGRTEADGGGHVLSVLKALLASSVVYSSRIHSHWRRLLYVAYAAHHSY